MGYTLQAIITSDYQNGVIDANKLHCVRLLVSDLYLIPLPFDHVKQHGIPFLPLTDIGDSSIGNIQHDLCCQLSMKDKCAYVEAEFFGGDGTQACQLFQNGKEHSKPIVDTRAINQALKWLGVKRKQEEDEFEVVGLGQERNTSDWIK